MKLNNIISFDQKDGHPQSKIVGIDHYTFDAQDGERRHWKSYTLVPVDTADCKGVYKRWYCVDLPDIGLSFVHAVSETDMPNQLEVEPKLTGLAVVETEGDGELGTGKSDLWSYWDNTTNPRDMYAKEVFTDGDTLYFKTTPLRAPVSVMA